MSADSKKPRSRSSVKSSRVRKIIDEDAPKRRGWLWFFGLPLFLLLLLVAVTPSILSSTSLGPWLAGRLVPLDGSLEIGTLSVGWFSPSEVTSLVLRDAKGEVVAKLAHGSSSQSLMSLLADHAHLGHLDLDHPDLHLVLTEHGSNLETVLAPLLTGKKNKTTLKLEVKVTEGQAVIDDLPSQRKYEVQKLTADAAWDIASPTPLQLQFETNVINGRRTATVAAKITAAGLDEEGKLGAGQANCQIKGLPLDTAEPLLRRYLAGAQLAGRLDAQLDCRWGEGEKHNQTSIQGMVELADLWFTATALGNDRIELEKLTAPCKIVGTAEELRIDQLEIDCDLGKIGLTGTARVADFSARDLLASLARETCQLRGEIDLVRVAALFPQTLHLRSDTQITSGKLHLTLDSLAKEDSIRWSGRVETSDLEAVSGGQTISWKQPLVLEFQARDGQNGPIVDKLDCTSSFLRIEAAGTLQSLHASANFYLDRLANELSRFVDLQGYQLAGTGEAEFVWQSAADGNVSGKAVVNASDFALVTPSRRPWREANLVVNVAAAGRVADRSIARLDSATLRLEAADELLRVALAQAVDQPLASTLPLNVDWQGELASLVPRIEPWVDLTGWEISGRSHLQASATASTTGVDIRQCKLNVERLHVWGQGLFIDDPQTEGSLAGSWHPTEGKLSVTLASLKGNSLVARVNNLELRTPSGEAPVEASGTATLHADMGMVARWLHDPRIPQTQRVAGQLAGQAELSWGKGSGKAMLTAAIENLQVSEQRAPVPKPAGLFQPAGSQVASAVWTEPKVQIGARVDYDPTRDLLQISSGQVQANAIRAEIAGKIATLSKAPNFDLSGQVQCDWEQTAPLWRPMIGDSLELVGSEPWPFVLQGPWTPNAKPAIAGLQRMTGSATVKWLSGKVRGLDLSSGAIDAVLRDGALTLKPVDVALSGGQVLLSPVVRLATQPPILELPPGPVVNNVRLTPEICARSLKFVMPVLAEVTRASGSFSISLQGGQVPLENPQMCNVVGELQVHQVEVRPGPIMQTLLGFTKQFEGIAQGQIPFANPGQAVALLRVDDQRVAFKIKDGRVYHEGLKLTAGNMTIVTRGSVGFDETLDVVAEVPTSANLLAKTAKIAGVNSSGNGSQTIQIPVQGSLRNPKINPLNLERATTKAVENEAKGLIFDRLQGELDKLLPRQR